MPSARDLIKLGEGRKKISLNGLMQQAKRAARGFRTATNFINIAYLRLSKLTHLPVSPFITAASR